MLLLSAACAPDAHQAQQAAADARDAHQANQAGENPSPTQPADPEATALRDDLGTHHHEITTTSDSARLYFDQGLRLTYAFNHAAAVASYEKAARFDPKCAMCYWGIAWASGPNINAALTPEGGAAAREAIRRALGLRDRVRLTGSERAIIEAMALRYEEDPLAGRARQDTSYARAMRAFAAAYPKDDDAQVLAAESIMMLSPWDYWYANGSPRPGTEETLALLRAVMDRAPEHAGACHYFIHVVEKVHASWAEACADRLAGLMPGAGHIVHMPSHIFVRIGRYADAIAANQGAVHAHTLHAAPAAGAGADVFDQGYGSHNYHFLAFAAQMAGSRRLALQTARELEARVDPDMMRAPGMGALQHYLCTPLRVMVRFGMWKEILAEPAPPEDLAYPRGTWRYARGMAFARTDRTVEADAELSDLRAILAGRALDGVGVWSLNSAYALLSIAERVLSGEIAAARGDADAAVRALEEGVALEAALTYDEPPPWPLPVRHILGAVLLDAGRPEEARTVYEQALSRFAENGYALRGLEESYAAQGRDEEAAAARARLTTAWRAADVELPGSRF